MELALFFVAIRGNDPIVAKIVARQRTNSLPLLTLTTQVHRFSRPSLHFLLGLQDQ